MIVWQVTSDKGSAGNDWAIVREKNALSWFTKAGFSSVCMLNFGWTNGFGLGPYSKMYDKLVDVMKTP